MKNNSLLTNENFLELNEEINKIIPNFLNIEKAIEKTSPAILSIAILEDVGFTYLLDYYLRHINPKTVKSILQNPMFSHEAMLELFYCQVTAFDKAFIQKKPLPDLFSSYWSELSKAEYAILFKNLMKKKTHVPVLKKIFEKIDLVYVRMMINSGALKSNLILEFFKGLGNDIQKFVANDIQLYDFAFGLALNNSDDQFLAFLEDYTVVFVQLRLVASFVDEVELEMKKNEGKPLSYVKLTEICSHIPTDCLNVTLDIFKDKKWVTENEKKSIQEFFNK